LSETERKPGFFEKTLLLNLLCTCVCAHLLANAPLMEGNRLAGDKQKISDHPAGWSLIVEM